MLEAALGLFVLLLFAFGLIEMGIVLDGKQRMSGFSRAAGELAVHRCYDSGESCLSHMAQELESVVPGAQIVMSSYHTDVSTQEAFLFSRVSYPPEAEELSRFDSDTTANERLEWLQVDYGDNNKSIVIEIFYDLPLRGVFFENQLYDVSIF